MRRRGRRFGTPPHMRPSKSSLSLAATEENIRLHLQLAVYEERRHPFSDIFSHGLPCGAGES